MSEEEHPMADYARSFYYRETHGHLPDDVFHPGPEDDPWDPDQQEVRALVEEQYAENNARRREETLRNENAALRQIIEDNGLPLPEDV